MRIGVQYYPEHWPRERWDVDAAMMRDAGVSVVRMGEFAWSAYEPREGELDFSWMAEAIDLLGRHGIRTILCTCSRTPPPWMYDRYPGILSMDMAGMPQPTDNRYRIGLAHAEFIEQSQRIDEAVIAHFAGCENVVAWQIDNEVGSQNDCFCPKCRTAFQTYLEAKYGSPDALNEAWGSHFWSFTFDDFSEVPAPHSQPQLVLEYRRFLSQLNVEFNRWRADLIRSLDPGKPVTSNFQSLGSSHTDYHTLKSVLDVNAMNHYPARSPELALDYYRADRGELWVLEQHTRLQQVDTADGMMRLWAWMAVAHGASTVCYFRWRQCRWGAEQFADGILPHSGDANRFYRELARIGQDAKQVGELVSKTRPHAQAAILFSYESRWAFKASRFGNGVLPVPEAMTYHKTLARRVTAIDALDPRSDLSAYSLVIAPRLWVVDQAIATNLRTYVENGGTLCLTVGSGVADEHGKSFDTPRPGPLRELAGITVSDLAHDPELQLALQSDAVPALDGTAGRLLADEIHLAGAEAIAVHGAGWRQGQPAITSYSVGNGRVIYVGTILDQAATDALVDWLCRVSELEQALAHPTDVSVYERSCDDYRLMFLLNWSEEARSVEMGEGWQDAFSDEPSERVEIPARDLRIMRSAMGSS